MFSKVKIILLNFYSDLIFARQQQANYRIKSHILNYKRDHKIGEIR